MATQSFAEDVISRSPDRRKTAFRNRRIINGSLHRPGTDHGHRSNKILSSSKKEKERSSDIILGSRNPRRLSFNFAVLSAWLRLITRARFRKKKKRNDKKNKEGGESFTITRGCTVHGNQVTNRAY